MNSLRMTLLLFLSTMLMVGCSSKPEVAVNYEVVPLPQNISIGTDGQFKLTNSTKISYPKGDDVQKQNAEFLAEYIKLSTGLNLSLTDTEQSSSAIVLKSDYKGEKAESYNLIVNDKLITINGSDAAGTFYGIQTLRKSMPANATENTVVFPSVDIKDYPRFGYRGMMLDVCRHYMPIEFVKKYIDILALHNINRFHWHLSEDQGWRIEIKKYPKLTEIGSMRAQTVVGRNNDTDFDGTPHGGFYTQEQIKDVVAYAQKRFITIIPEIDLPGHMLSALAGYPNLGCTGGPYKVGEKWGVFAEVLCAGNEETFEFLEGVFSEIIELFPSEYIHVGGDECPKTSWEKCPKCQARIKAEGIKGSKEHSAENQLQSYVISRVEKFLNSKGRQIIGWDEILEGGLAPNATVMSWRGIEGGIAAANMKHDAVMTPHTYLYFDYGQTTNHEREPLAMGRGNTPERVYNYEPVPSEIAPEVRKHIIGVQANLWTEYIETPEHVEHMVLPRMGSLSEIQWTMPEKKNYEKFEPRLIEMMKLYDRLGYNYAKYLLEDKEAKFQTEKTE